MMPDFDQSAFEKLRDKVLADIAGAMGAFMALIRDQTGVYKALERRGRCRPEELAALAGVDPRYLLEWLSSNAANGYVDYHPEDGTFSLSNEQAAIFADQKDDPSANRFALDYLRTHSEVASESVVWHTHELDAPVNRIEGQNPQLAAWHTAESSKAIRPHPY